VKNGFRGQRNLDSVAEEAGRTVRETMIRLSGTKPEYLPAATDIKQVQSGLKKTHRNLRSLTAIRRDFNRHRLKHSAVPQCPKRDRRFHFPSQASRAKFGESGRSCIRRNAGSKQQTGSPTLGEGIRTQSANAPPVHVKFYRARV
jgi:hypothetical protein